MFFSASLMFLGVIIGAIGMFIVGPYLHQRHKQKLEVDSAVISHEWKIVGTYYYGDNHNPPNIVWRSCTKCGYTQVHRGPVLYPDQSNAEWEDWRTKKKRSTDCNEIYRK